MTYQSGPNNLLRQARLAQRSPSGSGRAMSREELADAVNAYLRQDARHQSLVDAAYVGRLERGEHRWPSERYRTAFRTALGGATDADLGFFVMVTDIRPSEAGPGRRGPRQRRDRAAKAGISSEQLAEARKSLGRKLAEWRVAAGLTQAELAQRTCYSRTSITNLELGHQNTTRSFWRSADREVGAGGALLGAFDQVDALTRGPIAHGVGPSEQQRLVEHGSVAEADALRATGHAITVARWTGREVRALREALRMTQRAFAEQLEVTTTRVSSWENQRVPGPLSLATQRILDRALKLAELDVRIRFRQLLSSPAGNGRVHRSSGQDVGADNSNVTLIRPRRSAPTESRFPARQGRS